MLETIDLTKKMSKEEYKQAMPGLREGLFDIQKASWDAALPVMIVFEGWDAAGKGSSVQAITEHLDPRGFKLYPIRAARTYEKKRPWLWRFWTKIPARGEWAIFDRSWYGRVLVERVARLVHEKEWRLAYRDITDFERTLADDGYLIVKFFLHISKQDQKRRFDKLLKDPLTAWHVTEEDWEHHRHYDEWALAFEEMLERTDTEWGRWTIVEATDRRFRTWKIFHTLIQAIQERLEPTVAAPSAPSVSQAGEISGMVTNVESPESTMPDEPVEAGSPASEEVLPAGASNPAGQLPVSDSEAL